MHFTVLNSDLMVEYASGTYLQSLEHFQNVGQRQNNKHNSVVCLNLRH